MQYQLLVQIIHQLTSSGGASIKLNKLNMPGRTPKSLSHMITRIKAEAKAFSSAAATSGGGGGSAASSPAKSGRGAGSGGGVKKRASSGGGAAATARAKAKKQKLVEEEDGEQQEESDGEFETKPAIKKEPKAGMAGDVDEDLYGPDSTDGEV